LTRYDVPDDDMPENQLPPTWGPAYDERDLDALLSGDLASLPEALVPLAFTFAALHARPARAELAGEAAARAAFSHFRRDPGSWTDHAEPGTVLSHTLVLPRPEPDRPQRHTPRHRRRRAGGTLHRPLTIGGVAAAALLVAGVAVAALLPGPIQHLTHLGRSASPSAVAKGKGSGQPSQAPGVEITGKPEPVIRPTPRSEAKPGPGELCREYYAFFRKPEPKPAWAGELSLWRQLSRLVGDQWKVLSYCLPYLDSEPWGSKGAMVTPPHGNDPWPSGSQGNPGNGTGGAAGDNSGQPGTGTGNTAAPGASSTATSASSSDAGPGSGQPSHGQLDEPGSQDRDLSR
jgi:hypothetical protein